MNRPVIKQIAWFAVIGVINTGVDFAVLNLLMLAFGATSGMWFVAMKAVSFLAASVNSYFLNTRFTFGAARSPKSFGSFFVASVIGMLANVGLASIARIVFLNWLNPVLAANAAALVGTVVGLMVNFILYKYVVFARTERKDS